MSNSQQSLKDWATHAEYRGPAFFGSAESEAYLERTEVNACLGIRAAER